VRGAKAEDVSAFTIKRELYRRQNWGSKQSKEKGTAKRSSPREVRGPKAQLGRLKSFLLVPDLGVIEIYRQKMK